MNYNMYGILFLIKFIDVVVSEVGMFRGILKLSQISSQHPNITICMLKNCRHKFPSNYKPSQFLKCTFPSYNKPLQKLAPLKGPLKNISPGAYFQNFTVF